MKKTDGLPYFLHDGITVLTDDIEHDIKNRFIHSRIQYHSLFYLFS